MKKILIILLLMFSLQISAGDKFKEAYIPINIQMLDREGEILNNIHYNWEIFDNKKKCRNYVIDQIEENPNLFSGSVYKKFISKTDGLVENNRGMGSYLFCQKIYLNKKVLGLR